MILDGSQGSTFSSLFSIYPFLFFLQNLFMHLSISPPHKLSAEVHPFILKAATLTSDPADVNPRPLPNGVSHHAGRALPALVHMRHTN